MDLILWRHAEAEERRPGLPDERRRLTPKGEKQAYKVAKWLKKHLPKDARILVSPTERTLMTAHALGLPYEIEESIAPEASAAGLLDAAGWPDGKGLVLVVGHQPTLGRTASILLADEEFDLAVRKAAAWWFRRADDGTGELRAVADPNLL